MDDMELSTRDQIAIRLKDLQRRVVDPSLQQPALWRARAEELQRLTDDGETAAARLVDLYLAYTNELMAAWHEHFRIIAQADDLADSPPVSLVYEFMNMTHFVLLSLGTRATHALWQAYNTVPAGTSQRLLLLYLLAATGDAALEKLFRNLTVEEIAQANEADEELANHAYSAFPPFQDVARANTESGQQVLARLRINYEQACSRQQRDDKQP